MRSGWNWHWHEHWRWPVLLAALTGFTTAHVPPDREPPSSNASIEAMSPAWRDASARLPVGALRTSHLVLPLPHGPDVRVELVRITPTRFHWDLRNGTPAGPTPRTYPRRASWNIDSAAPGAVAFSAGFFSRGVPWGWVIRNGRELQPPGTGPLVRTLVISKTGRASLLTPDAAVGLRAHDRDSIALAIQAYPALLENGRIPDALATPGRGVDHTHRDARLALGILPDGDILLALTRLDIAPGEPAPFGPTSPEMAQIMRRLGCVHAVLLDGGLSSQIAIPADSGRQRWPGLRSVALGIEAAPR